jgi:hypothetical protein
MSSDLERRVARALQELPGPSAEAEQVARRAVLEALPRPGRRPGVSTLRILALAGAAVGVLAAGAAALAAIGGIEVRLGTPKRAPSPAPPRLNLPRGAHGFAVFTGGKLWLTTRVGVRIEGLGVSAVALSPRARFVAVGVGNELVAMAPNRRQAWARTTRGRVVAAAWSPDGLKIAYVVARASPRADQRNEIRLIEGDGDHDRLLDVGVAQVSPSWRSDSLALAYAGIGGGAIVYDLGHLSRRLIEPRCHSPGPVRALAFAPTGRELAALTPTGVLLAGGRSRPAECLIYPDVLRLTGVAWLGPREFVTSERPYRVEGTVYLRRWLIDAPGRLVAGGKSCSAGGVMAIASSPSGGRVAAAFERLGGKLEVRELGPGTKWDRCLSLTGARRVLELRRARTAQLAWR